MANNSRKVKLLLGKQPESTSRATGQAGAMHLWQASTAQFAPVHPRPGKSKILAALDRREEEESSEINDFFEGPKGANSGSDDSESDDGAGVRSSPAGDNIQEKTCKVKIRYNFTLYSAAEMKKPKGQRTGKASSTELSSDMPWIDFYEELKMHAAKLYSKPILDNLHNFQINYTIPRVSTDLLALEAENDYEHLLENVVSSKKKDILIKVQISELQTVSEKENINPNESGTDDEPPRKKQKKGKSSSTKTQKSDILPANQALDENITTLRKRWTCSLTSCRSDHCFIPADGSHLYLSHEHLEKWAAAMLRNDDSATLEMPPSITLFDAVSARKLVSKSPILQARLDQIAKSKLAQTPTVPTSGNAPVINFVLPNNVYPPFVQQPTFPFGNVAPTGQAPALQSCSSATSLILAGYRAGPKQLIHEFCRSHGLSDSILERFKENAFTGTHAFRHLNDSDLQAMSFKPGEIIDIKDAIEEWAIKID